MTRMPGKKRSLRSGAKQIPLPLFWPDDEGSIRTPDPRAWKRHIPRRRSISTWILAQATGAIGFGAAREFAFRTWLERALVDDDFGVLTIGQVIDRAQRDLEIDMESAIRYLAANTSDRGRCRSDGEVVTLR